MSRTFPAPSVQPSPPARPAPRPSHVRRLAVAGLVFAGAVVLVGWLVGELILRDLSSSYVTGIITQAKEEAESVAAVAGDPGMLGEGEEQEAVRGGADAAIDADVILDPLLSDLRDERGRPLDSDSIGMPGASPLLPEVRVGGEGPRRRIPGVLATSGQEMRYIANGELIARDAVQYIHVRYPGGERYLHVRTLDRRDVDPEILRQPEIVERVPIHYRPTSRRVTISWDADLGGQRVELEAGIDAAVIEEGVSELRAQVVPKIVTGGVVFGVLLLLAFLWVVRLLGEARRLEAEAREQALLAQVGMLAAGLAHEIRNPLSAVHMNLQLLEEDLGQGTDRSQLPDVGLTQPVVEEQRGLLRSARREIRRLGRLVSDFLAYARPAAPRPEARVLDEVVGECIELFQPTAEGDGVTLTADLDSGAEPILLDESLVKQALMNVILNALEAVRRPGGRVSVTTRREGSTCEVVVGDDGPGLPEDPEELFRVFHSTKKGGSGLGLPISRAIAERHGGSLVGRRSPREGAEFVLRLPVAVP